MVAAAVVLFPRCVNKFRVFLQRFMRDEIKSIMRFHFLFFILLFSASNVYAAGNVYVLCYHSFLGENNQYDFSPEQFKSQMEEIQNIGYRFVSFNDIRNNKVSGDNNVLITIDDGNSSIQKIYEEVLKPMGIMPILFIYPSVIDHGSFALKSIDLVYYLKEGITIGAHGYKHTLFVNQKLYDKDRWQFNREIYGSKIALEKMLSDRVEVYAYPFGRHSPITISSLKNAGYKYAFSLTSAQLKAPIDTNENLFTLPRYLVTKDRWDDIYNMLKKNVLDLNLGEKDRTNAGGKKGD